MDHFCGIIRKGYLLIKVWKNIPKILIEPPRVKPKL